MAATTGEVDYYRVEGYSLALHCTKHRVSQKMPQGNSELIILIFKRYSKLWIRTEELECQSYQELLVSLTH